MGFNSGFKGLSDAIKSKGRRIDCEIHRIYHSFLFRRGKLGASGAVVWGAAPNTRGSGFDSLYGS